MRTESWLAPKARLNETIAVAERLRKVEIRIQQKVRSGSDLAALLRYDELLENKAATGGLPQNEDFCGSRTTTPLLLSGTARRPRVKKV